MYLFLISYCLLCDLHVSNLLVKNGSFINEWIINTTLLSPLKIFHVFNIGLTILLFYFLRV